MFDYEIGGNEVKKDSNEGILKIQPNRTLIAQKLTQEPDFTPEKVEDLRTMDDVFGHYKPSVEVALQDKNGDEVQTKVNYNKVADFSPKQLLNQVDFLSDMDMELKENLTIIKKLNSNKTLQGLINKEEAKESLIELLKSSLAELEK